MIVEDSAAASGGLSLCKGRKGEGAPAASVCECRTTRRRYSEGRGGSHVAQNM